MGQHLPKRLFYALSDLKECWGISRSELQQWLVNGDLSTHVWLPVMSVYKHFEENDGVTLKLISELSHWEGYASISRHYCHRLFRQGSIHLREFSSDASGQRYKLPEASDDVIVNVEDLVILEEERRRFEAEHHLAGTCPNVRAVNHRPEQLQKSDGLVADHSFKIIKQHNNEYRLGDMQAKILRQLYESAKDGNPWQNGKKLLQEAGSQSFTLSNIFKRNPIWKKLIISDGRGSYRLNSSSVRLD